MITDPNHDNRMCVSQGGTDFSPYNASIAPAYEFSRRPQNKIQCKQISKLLTPIWSTYPSVLEEECLLKFAVINGKIEDCNELAAEFGLAGKLWKCVACTAVRAAKPPSVVAGVVASLHAMCQVLCSGYVVVMPLDFNQLRDALQEAPGPNPNDREDVVFEKELSSVSGLTEDDWISTDSRFFPTITAFVKEDVASSDDATWEEEEEEEEGSSDSGNSSNGFTNGSSASTHTSLTDRSLLLREAQPVIHMKYRYDNRVCRDGYSGSCGASSCGDCESGSGSCGDSESDSGSCGASDEWDGCEGEGSSQGGASSGPVVPRKRKRIFRGHSARGVVLGMRWQSTALFKCLDGGGHWSKLMKRVRSKHHMFTHYNIQKLHSALKACTEGLNVLLPQFHNNMPMVPSVELVEFVEDATLGCAPRHLWEIVPNASLSQPVCRRVPHRHVVESLPPDLRKGSVVLWLRPEPAPAGALDCRSMCVFF